MLLKSLSRAPELVTRLWATEEALSLPPKLVTAIITLAPWLCAWLMTSVHGHILGLVMAPVEVVTKAKAATWVSKS